jgi:hypothetical protein
MKKWFLRSVLTLFMILVVAGVVYHLGLRNWCLRWGTTDAELHSAFPGDDLFPTYASDATHAITIHASPEKIWPWLMQIGQDRSGFYSYTFLENVFGCDMPKVEHLVPDWKARAAGETVWFCDPKRFPGQGKMIPAVIEPERAYALVMQHDWERLQNGGRIHDGMWSFTLLPVSDQETRLIVRARGGTPPTFASRLTGRLFWEPAHFVMEQKMLRTIRDLAERS